jgi:hypothetical protein
MSIRDVKEEDRDKAALDYHEFPTPGKVTAATGRAYSPRIPDARAYLQVSKT